MRIAIIGLGLIGGSIGLALKKAAEGRDLRITGIPRREETVQEAVSCGAIDEGTTDTKKGVENADLIFICTPINLILPILKDVVPHLKAGAIVTDVGSSKAEIVSQAERAVPKGVYFVGGHPMAGKEKVKLEEAEADLFKGKTYLLTPTSRTSKKALEKVRYLVGLVGARIMEMDPKLHDLVVAAVSHMPLAVAAALVNTVEYAQKGKDEMMQCAASGFRDTTRIASGDPSLGVDMFTTNKNSVLKMLSAFKKSLGRIEMLIKEGDPKKIEKELDLAKIFRDSIYG